MKSISSDLYDLSIISLNELSLNQKEELLALDQRFFPNPWKKEQWFLNDESARYSLALMYQHERLFGFSLFYLIPEDNFGHLLKVLIDPEFRNMNLGQDLLKFHMTQLQDCHNFYLEVEHDNLSAISLYQKLGFKSLRSLKNFYGNGRDGIAMNIELVK